MGTALRTLLVAPTLEALCRLDLALGSAEALEIVARAMSGGEALAALRSELPELVAIDGEIDGCFGARLASVLRRERDVALMILVPAGQEAAARSEAEARNVDRVQVIGGTGRHADGAEASLVRTQLQLLGARERASRPRGCDDDTVLRPELAPALARPYDVVAVLGSAGTPHMLPRLLSNAEMCGVPIVVAVHHNPRLSDSFCGFVGELCGRPPVAVDLDETAHLDLRHELLVAKAPMYAPALAPDLDRVLAALRGQAILACVASGMGMQGIDGLRGVRAAGGYVVALDPSRCSQPAMPTATIAAGLADAVVTDAEMAELIGFVGSEFETRSARGAVGF